ncbi:hypothetical protein ACWD00_41600 [Streptomyces viridiviolaceus]
MPVVTRRPAPPDRTKALAENQIAALWRLDVALREKLKAAGSLVTNQVRAYDPLRMSGREGARLRWVRRSRSTGGSRRPSTCCGWSALSTTPTGGR